MDKTRFVICDRDKTAFFRQSAFYTDDIFLARHFLTQEEAERWRNYALSSFQTSLLTEVVPIQVSITINMEEP